MPGVLIPHNKGNGDNLSSEDGDNYSWLSRAKRNGDKLSQLVVDKLFTSTADSCWQVYCIK